METIILRTSVCSIQAAADIELSEDTFSLSLSTGVYICFELDYQTYHVVLQLGSLENCLLEPDGPDGDVTQFSLFQASWSESR